MQLTSDEQPTSTKCQVFAGTSLCVSGAFNCLAYRTLIVDQSSDKTAYADSRIIKFLKMEV